MDWSDITSKDIGENPVCLVGAGFQKAVLKKPMPSTKEIIKKTVEEKGDEFPILSRLCSTIVSPCLDLNYVWTHIWCLSSCLCIYYSKIKEDYSKLDNKITRVIEEYETGNATTTYSGNVILPQNPTEVINTYETRKTTTTYSVNNVSPQKIIWVVLGLELKKMVAYQYDSNKIGAFKRSAICNMKCLISQSRKFTWISLNYDIVLEKMLVCEIKGRNGSNLDFRVKYAFEPLLTNKSSTKEHFEKTPKTVEYSPKVKERNGKWDKSKYSNDDSEHLLIKPHGSVNVVFETDNQNTENKIHKIYYKDESNYFATFDWEEMGYNIQQNKINEKRPWMIGYLPDDLKDELNSNALFSDLAHDLCKWNMAYSSFALENATSLFILGYRMPREDQWVWARVKNIENKKLNIYVASGSSSDYIKQELKNNGFTKVKKVNNGYIDHI